MAASISTTARASLRRRFLSRSCTRTTRLRYPAHPGNRQDCQGKAFCSIPTACRRSAKFPVDVQPTTLTVISADGRTTLRPEGAALSTCGVAIHVCSFRADPTGGGHERGMRSGTLKRAGIVGFGKAAELCQNEMAEESARLRGMRDRLKDGPFASLTSSTSMADDAPAAAQHQHQLRVRRDVRAQAD